MNDERLIPLLERYAQTKDKALRDQLFEAYLPLSGAIANKFTGRGVAKEDLEQVAGMALLKALEHYQPERGFRFATYAAPTITGDLRNYFRDKSSTIRLSRDYRQQLYAMTQARESFEREFLRTPSAMELAQSMGVSPDELATLMAMKAQAELVSLDAPLDNEGDGTLGELVGVGDSSFEKFEQSEWMKWILSKVTPQERTLLLLRYRDRLGQRETAKKLGVSQMQVSRLERRALAKLRILEQSESR